MLLELPIELKQFGLYLLCAPNTNILHVKAINPAHALCVQNAGEVALKARSILLEWKEFQRSRREAPCQ